MSQGAIVYIARNHQQNSRSIKPKGEDGGIGEKLKKNEKSTENKGTKKRKENEREEAEKEAIQKEEKRERENDRDEEMIDVTEQLGNSQVVLLSSYLFLSPAKFSFSFFLLLQFIFFITYCSL